MFDNILSLSILWRPTYSIFTRCQRFSCLMATFYLNMTISSMWYNTNSSKAEYRITIGALTISYMQFYVGSIALTISVPFVAALNTLFRYRKLNIKTLKFDNVKQNSFLPHWISYVGHVICIITIICGFLVTFLYSLQWGGETSMSWLMSILFGALIDSTTGPIQVCDLYNLQCVQFWLQNFCVGWNVGLVNQLRLSPWISRT